MGDGRCRWAANLPGWHQSLEWRPCRLRQPEVGERVGGIAWAVVVAARVGARSGGKNAGCAPRSATANSHRLALEANTHPRAGARGFLLPRYSAAFATQITYQRYTSQVCRL